MPSYNFGDSENQNGPAPAGDYVVEVISVDFGLSNGPKTRGSDKMNLKLRVEKTNTTLHEFLILHKSCEWKIDTFVKSCNLLVNGKPPVKGQEIDFSDDMLVGLRGWCALTVDNSDPSWPRNKVAVWITNKEKLAKAERDEFSDDADGAPF